MRATVMVGGLALDRGVCQVPILRRRQNLGAKVK